jgi:dolichol-phosphate mannosyltransferase
MKSARREPEATPGVSVIIPTYEEAATIGRVIQEVTRAVGELGYAAEVIVVDDDSPDGTADLAESASRTSPLSIRVLRRNGPRSLSLSVMDGARLARHALVAVLDADLSHDPRDIPRILEPVLKGRADISLGSRYAAGGKISAWPLHRRIVSALGIGLARRLTRVRDPLSGYFATRREILDGSAIELKPRGYKILLEILARGRGLRIAEIPIRFRDRSQGQSKLGLRQGLEFMNQCLSLLRHRIEGVFAGGATAPLLISRVKPENQSLGVEP